MELFQTREFAMQLVLRAAFISNFLEFVMADQVEQEQQEVEGQNTLLDLADELLDPLNNKTEQSDDRRNATLCTNLSTNDHVSEGCKFWIQGVFLTLIGICGIIGNCVSN
jgi:hypothetical protein